MRTVMKIQEPTNASGFDVNRIRKDFPIFEKKIGDKPLVYLDSAASAQKPRQVIARMEEFYAEQYSNVHRGLHALSQKATDLYEGARETVRQFINASQTREIIFVRGATEGINLVAHTYGRQHVKKGDEIIISAMEHHSNIVPWQILCEQAGAALKIIPMNQKGELLLDAFEKMITEKTRLVSVVHVSNVLGTINPVEEIIKIAHARKVPVLLDGAQAVPHMKVDVQALDCDFYVFSGHKLFGPTGIGVLYGKAKLLEAMPPYQGGGDMIASVTFEKTDYNVIPYKFEAGTPHIAGVIGLAASIDYLHSLDRNAASRHEEELLRYATEEVSKIPEVRLIGTASHKTGVLSFIMGKIHPHDIGTILDQEGIAIRAGHHCAQPVMDFYHIPATARASFAFYNTKEDVDCLVKGLKKVIKIFG